MTIEKLKQQGWKVEIELQEEYWVAFLRNREGYLQETGKGKTKNEAISKLEENYTKSQRFYKTYFQR